MDNQPWLDSVREQLARHGLPPSYVQRFTEELGDHLDDLSEEGLEVDASSRLGKPKQVAEAAVVAYRRRSFLGRHPVAAFLVFAISPVIPLYVLTCASVAVFMIVSGLRLFDWYEQRWTYSLILVVCSTSVAALYSELSTSLGIGKKWALVSCAVLGAIAMLLGSGARSHTLMLLVQFAAPFAVGWWFTRRKCDHGHPATTFLVFAISPVASQLVLLSIVALAIATAYPLISGPATFANERNVPAVLLAPLFVLLMTLIPTVVPSLFYCKLAKKFGLGKKWMFVSCMVLATFAAVLSFQAFRLAEYDTPEGQHWHSPIGLTLCITLVQFVVPLTIGWWFMRRKPGQGRLELA